ncbi:DUF4921 family protein [Cellulomonas carbonis]|uniref:UTP--glucose-1-phosphate uridylyltransferase n=1 Tax=Cellulomonas carbonis T26 TaxID=947969 RepID=A0A0A0BSD9_9CELL|nr:DUF4921 family protein [Cellulomonas carbonis]KGM10825.1 UTP--glucose-1-phosphate uridylyltransferase [Cellulomonas carbonis T26]GGC16049.1 hypothetical protein GCM10010972_31670 [Cellulomonas carbonis]
MRDAAPSPLVRLPDGTVKQTSPLTGTEVWSVPRRAHRPMSTRAESPRPRPDHDLVAHRCAFCPGRYLETPPEKARVERDGDAYVLRTGLLASEVTARVAELRRFPNLYEIVGVDFWRADHGWVVPDHVRARAAAYLAEPEGAAHVAAILRLRAAAAGAPDAWDALDDDARVDRAADLFAGTHDVVVARRHHVDGAEHGDELAGAGTLTPDEHDRFVRFTVEAVRSLYAEQPHARYVSAFQNWLRPAGASFDHLHKQVVAIDEVGPRVGGLLERLRAQPDVVRRRVLDHARDEGLVVARTDRAVAVAAVGRPYPSFEVWSLDDGALPWQHDDVALRDMADLLHAVHAATGPAVPSNEEWYHRPPDADERLPWHVVVARRDATAAGFEASTGIHVTTTDPRTLRDAAVTRLRTLRDEGEVAPLTLGDA